MSVVNWSCLQDSNLSFSYSLKPLLSPFFYTPDQEVIFNTNPPFPLQMVFCVLLEVVPADGGASVSPLTSWQWFGAVSHPSFSYNHFTLLIFLFLVANKVRCSLPLKRGTGAHSENGFVLVLLMVNAGEQGEKTTNKQMEKAVTCTAVSSFCSFIYSQQLSSRLETWLVLKQKSALAAWLKAALLVNCTSLHCQVFYGIFPCPGCGWACCIHKMLCGCIQSCCDYTEVFPNFLQRVLNHLLKQIELFCGKANLLFAYDIIELQREQMGIFAGSLGDSVRADGESVKCFKLKFEI